MAKQKPKYLATTDLIDDNTIATSAQLATKQNVLVSGTNIKTVNSSSLLGSGDLVVGGVTNSAGSNVIPKSDGTNLVGSQITDDGTTVTIITTEIRETQIIASLADGGSITLSAGGNEFIISSPGADNYFKITGLPTSDPGDPGRLWNNGGRVMISI